jgi:hypothetical protein
MFFRKNELKNMLASEYKKKGLEKNPHENQIKDAVTVRSMRNRYRRVSMAFEILRHKTSSTRL